MAIKKLADFTLDELGFGQTDEKGFRTITSERFDGAACHADFLNGKICIQGIGPGGGYKTGYLSVSGSELRTLLTIIVTNYI